MTQIKYGGPAFPFRGIHATDEQHDGMTLRDYFAAKAMQAMMSAPQGKFKHGAAKDISSDAYIVADEMLRARGTS